MHQHFIVLLWFSTVSNEMLQLIYIGTITAPQRGLNSLNKVYESKH